jgi:pimeloyl-ACP methyl ester carboxylesterase
VKGLFVPGWGATAGLYAPALPEGWQALEPPTFRASGGDLLAYRHWLETELDRQQAPVTLAGHSMGAALALLAAIARRGAVHELILIAPAGLPLEKSLPRSLATFVQQVVRGWYPHQELRRTLSHTAAAPLAALRLAHAVHDLDLGSALEQLRATAIPTTVIACTTDALTTPAHCRRLAGLLGADYRELQAPGGHVWMLAQPRLLTTTLWSSPR